MLYLLAENFIRLEFLKSIYLRGFLAFVISFLIVLLSGNKFINYLKIKKFGENIRNEGPETHKTKKGTPTMGGVLIVFSILITSLISTNIFSKYIVIVFISTILFAAIGFVDDYKKFKVSKKGLSGKKKLMGQGIISFIVWFFVYKFGMTGNYRIDMALVNPINGSWFYIGYFLMFIFILLIIMASSNSVNITDGLDGLAIMPMVICSAVLATIAYFSGHIEISSHLKLFYIPGISEIGIFLCSVAGSGLAFLWYNFYPAQIFMGDTGSLTLGGILGVCSILLKQEFILPIIGFVFVIEAASVIFQVLYFKKTGKRIFKMAPLHHHYELSGLMETKITVRFWITSLIFGILALGIIRMRGFI